MTDTERLNELIQQSGYKLSYIAKRLGLSTYGFSRKRDNLNEFTPSEINALCELLNITSLEDRFAIFFAQRVDVKSTEETRT
jgi:hypothetical protein